MKLLPKAGSPEWLLIVDDVEDTSLGLLKECLPRTGRSGSIIFTTRSDEAARSLVERDAIVPLNPPSNDLAVEIFLKCSGKPPTLTSSADLRRANLVAALVDCMPLALEQAATVLKQIQGSNLETELQTIHKKPDYRVNF